MAILTLGVSYRRAPVDLLERLAFVQDEDAKAYRRLREQRAVHEGVILSTCNRVEVYADVSAYHAGFLDLKRFLCGSEVSPEELAEPLYSHYEEDAADHLFSVAAGIDSMVLGEPQILSQVRDAFRRAGAEGATGAMMSALFRGAIRTGRRARAETAIGVAPSALVAVGAELAARALGGLADRSVAVIGAGGMAALAATHARDAGVGSIRILNRGLERGRSLAARTGGEAAGLDSLVQGIAEADLVVASTGAAGLVVGLRTVGEALRVRGSGRPLFLLDLAVPRDIDPSAADLTGVTLADIDDLKAELAARNQAPSAEVERVRGIVAEEVKRFAEWRRAARLAPLIAALRARGARIQRAELNRASARLAGLSDREREAVEAMAAGIVAKLLHDPIVRLKELSGPGTGDTYARVLAELFQVELPRDAS